MARPTTVSIIKSALLLFFLGIFGVTIAARFATASHAQNGGSATSATPAQTPPATTEKTVEQVYKNIKVLNGMPASQLMMAMNFMRASLGVSCAFCHVQNGNDWDFAADTKREKGTARAMIQMVQGINKDSFKGQVRVSCFTCHQGHEHTNGIPPLPQAEPEGGPGGPGPRPAGPGGPGAPGGPAEVTPDQLFEKFVTASGGRAALEAAKSRNAKATQNMSGDRVQNIEITQATGNKILIGTATPQGPVLRGYDGTKGWQKGPRGSMELPGDQSAQLAKQADFKWLLNLKARYTNTRLIGKDKIGEHEVYVVAGQVNDDQRDRLFFDTQTGLLLRQVTQTKSLVGWIPEQTDYEDYRDIGGGVKFPFTVKLSLVDPWSSWTRKFTEIKLNVPVDDKTFEMPAAPAAPAKP
jgi:hypothetical protein